MVGFQLPKPLCACARQEDTELGTLVVRPLHESHAYETALILTEAFLIDNQPPKFDWMLCATLPHSSVIRFEPIYKLQYT